jgi:hypothetical protein
VKIAAVAVAAAMVVGAAATAAVHATNSLAGSGDSFAQSLRHEYSSGGFFLLVND